MSSFGVCYCGKKLSKKSVQHLVECRDWKLNSSLYKAAAESIKLGSLRDFVRLECEALLLTSLLNPPQVVEQEMLAPAKREPIQDDYELAIKLSASQSEGDLFECTVCGKRTSDLNEIFFPDGCPHMQCQAHPIQAILTEYAQTNQVTCPFPECTYTLRISEMEPLVGHGKLEELREASFKMYLASSGGTLLECVCGNVSIVEPGKIEAFKDEKGNELSPEAAEHMAFNRFRCGVCKRTICANCKADPYHLGFTCEAFAELKASKQCRYCGTVIKSSQSTCKDPDCLERFEHSCKKVMDCGHQCGGINEERACLGCLSEECVVEGPNEHDFCTICYSEGLGAAPAIKLACGHFLHHHCVLLSLEKRWVGPRITFNFAKCPSCKEWVKALQSERIEDLMEGVISIYADVAAKALKRLKFENMEEDERLKNPESPYCDRPELYALDRFAYYMCFKCSQPYFGGKKECEQNLERDNYKPEELVCPSCAAIGVEGRDCPTHGKDFIEFKCKFCCSIACWFCWGNTHFCDPCHTRQNNGDYLTKKKREELQVCLGPDACPLKVDHPPNGEEYALGCAVCRNMQSNHQGF